MEEIWQEKWETAQKENNSLRSRISQLETEAQKSNEMMKARNDQLEAMKSQIDKTIAENQSLKTGIEQLEANGLRRRQELIKQCQKTDKLERIIKYIFR